MQQNFRKAAGFGPQIRDIIDNDDHKAACAKAGLDIAVAEQLIESCLAGFVTALKPVIMPVMGIPGSGKSTFLNAIDTPNTLKLGFDDIMTRIPAYAEAVQVDKEGAYKNWTLCARAIGYEILFRAFERQLNIAFEHSGTREDHIALLSFMQGQGYRVDMIVIRIDQELAEQRAATRTAHFLPSGMIAERHAIFERLLPQYQALADSYTEFRATQAGNVLVLDAKTPKGASAADKSRRQPPTP